MFYIGSLCVSTIFLSLDRLFVLVLLYFGLLARRDTASFSNAVLVFVNIVSFHPHDTRTPPLFKLFVVTAHTWILVVY